MSTALADLDATLKRVESELSARDSAAFALEAAKLDALKREADVRENDLQTYPERCRQQRHHDVLCLVLKEVIRDGNAGALPTSKALRELFAAIAKEVADLAYPPPKAEP